MCAVSTSRQAGEGLRALDRCTQAGGRRRGEATARTESNWSRVKASYLSLQLHPHDESVAGNKHRPLVGRGWGDREMRSWRWSDSYISFLSSLKSGGRNRLL